MKNYIMAITMMAITAFGGPKMEELTFEQKVGQCFVMGFAGTTPEDAEVQRVGKYIHDGLLGGVILYAYNIVSPDQVRTLVQYLKAQAPAGLPLIVAIDQEGGRVQRLKEEKGFTQYPSAAVVGREKTLDAAREIYKRLAGELKKYGFNLNFAPVADLELMTEPGGVIGTLERSFGADVDKVVQYGEAVVDAHRAHNIATSLKHYPGHGSSKGDSHAGYVDVTPVWTERELEPFDKLIASDHADMIMTAHIFNENWDPDLPVTLSPTFLKEHLRGYPGIIISDDLDMGALRQKYEVPFIINKTFEAGCDMAIVSNNPAAAKGVEDYKPNPDLPSQWLELLGDKQSDAAFMDHLNASVTKVLALKERL